MSGGRLDYKQWVLNETIASILDEMEDIDANVEEDGQQEELLWFMRTTVEALELAKVSVTRLDWYLSGDDSFEIYKQRLKDDLVELLNLNKDKDTK